MADTVDSLRNKAMSKTISPIWTKKLPQETQEKLREILQSVADGDRMLQVFFRADDIAVAGELFRRLMHLFLFHKMPLCLAVVPDWLNQSRWKEIQEFNPKSSLWCWHQHGRSHRNYEKQGKKGEFGDSRTEQAISIDLTEGRNILVKTMGDLFYPVFTPPWNRCGITTLNLLRELGFKAVSRSKGAKPAAKGILPDFTVNVDLHTRRESDFSEGWQNLMAEFAAAAGNGRMGIMLHHQLMNEEAFAFLDLLLAELRSCRNVSCCTFRELQEISR